MTPHNPHPSHKRTATRCTFTSCVMTEPLHSERARSRWPSLTLFSLGLMRALRAIIVFFAVGTLLSGCTPRQEIELYNDTGSAIVVTALGTQSHLRSATFFDTASLIILAARAALGERLRRHPRHPMDLPTGQTSLVSRNRFGITRRSMHVAPISPSIRAVAFTLLSAGRTERAAPESASRISDPPYHKGLTRRWRQAMTGCKCFRRHLRGLAGS